MREIGREKKRKNGGGKEKRRRKMKEQYRYREIYEMYIEREKYI